MRWRGGHDDEWLAIVKRTHALLSDLSGGSVAPQTAQRIVSTQRLVRLQELRHVTDPFLLLFSTLKMLLFDQNKLLFVVGECVEPNLQKICECLGVYGLKC